MRKSLAVFGLCFSWLFIPAGLQGLDILLKLSSGLWRMYLAEVNSALTGWKEGLERESAANPNARFTSGEVGRLRLGMDFEAEIILSLSRWFRLGLSAGYSHGSLDEEANRLTIEQSGIPYEWTRPTKVNAHPLLVSGYFNLPLGKKFNAYLRAGAGAIQARLITREGQKKATDSRFNYSVSDNAKASRLVSVAGLGFGYAFDPSLGFFIETSARFARLEGLTGEDRLGQKGTLYSYEEGLPASGSWRTTMRVLPEEPTGVNIRNVHKAVVDFSGYSIKIGLLLKF